MTLGYILEDMELFPEARPYYQAAQDIRQDSWTALFALARLDVYQGDHRQAVQRLRQLRTLVPGDALERIDVGYFLADSLIELRHYMEAERVIDETVALDPNRPEGYAHRAELCFMVSREEDALEAIRKAQSLAPSPEGYRMREARFLKFLNRHPEALRLLKDMVEKDHDDDEAWELMSELHLIRHEFEPAYDALSELQRLDPDSFHWYLQARCLFHLKRTDEALERVNRYLQHVPDHGEAYVMRAKLNVATQFDHLAYQDLQRADALMEGGLVLDDEDQYHLEKLIRSEAYRAWFTHRLASDPAEMM